MTLTTNFKYLNNFLLFLMNGFSTETLQKYSDRAGKGRHISCRSFDISLQYGLTFHGWQVKRANNESKFLNFTTEIWSQWPQR